MTKDRSKYSLRASPSCAPALCMAPRTLTHMKASWRLHTSYTTADYAKTVCANPQRKTAYHLPPCLVCSGRQHGQHLGHSRGAHSYSCRGVELAKTPLGIHVCAQEVALPVCAREVREGTDEGRIIQMDLGLEARRHAWVGSQVSTVTDRALSDSHVMDSRAEGWYADATVPRLVSYS